LSTTQDNVERVSGVLQTNWSLASPAESDILWSTNRVDAATFLSSGKSYAVGCYNPASPTQVDSIANDVWKQTEHVMVDVYVKVATTQDAAVGTREDLRNEIYRILNSKTIPINGLLDWYVDRETTKVEGPDLVRLTLQVACVTFNLST
jgi:hypothetical protein